MNQFLAIGVSEGDAFILTRGSTTALVDGGKRVGGFQGQFSRATKLSGVTYVVCTHNDADHANGILGFLQAGFGCDEIWLPASWADSLPDLAAPKAVWRLAHECEELELTSEDTLERLGDAVADSQLREEPVASAEAETPAEGEETFRGPAPTGEIDGLDRWISWGESAQGPWLASLDWAQGGHCYVIDGFAHWSTIEQLNSAQTRIFIEAVAAGARIAGIAREAFDRGIPVRWFRFGQRATGGVRNFLVPVNSCEVARVQPRTRLPLVFRLALTVANRESLVFHSPSAAGVPGVLFSSDSDFRFEPALPRGIGLVTAPHHGSQTNAFAYDRIDQDRVLAPGAVWVRSDSRSQPGSAFVDRAERKFCTLCRVNGAAARLSQRVPSKHDVRLFARSGTWNPELGIPVCKCG